MTQCQAKSKRSGEQCKKDAIPGKRVCHIHGGKTPGGVESPNFKHGAYSRYIPKGIRGDYEAALNNPQSLSLRDDIATVDGRIGEIFRGIDGKETPQFMESAGEAAGKILKALERYGQAAIRSRDGQDERVKLQSAKEMRDALVGIEELAGGLQAQAASAMEVTELWKEAYGLIEQRRRLVESEHKLKIELRQTITKERALILFGAMVEQFRIVVQQSCDPILAREIMLQTGQKVQTLIGAGRMTVENGE